MSDRHYSAAQWQSYRSGQVSKDVAQAMEDHLRACDGCLQTYLTSLRDDELELAEVFLDDGLATRVVAKALAERRGAAQGQASPSDRSAVRPPRAVWPALRNYLIAAAFTAVLFGGGWFTAISSEIPSAFLGKGRPLEVVEERLPSWWPRDLGERIGDWLGRFIK